MAAAVGSAGASNQTVTLGSTSGTPSVNVASCASTIVCTFVPFLGVSNPELQVPFNGTVTSFSVNAGSATGSIWLRVLRPAPGGQFAGAGTSQPETIATLGVNTYAVSLPVKAGDVLALDNDSSAIMFDTSSATSITAYYELPALADGQTAAPNHVQSGYRLLLSATVQSSATTTTGPPPPAPVVSHVTQTHRKWREGTKPAKFTRASKPPIGTTFSFTLNESARVTFLFEQQLTGRRVKGKCVAGSHPHHPACKRTVLRGRMSFTGHAGTNSVVFDGRVSSNAKLPVGSYSLMISATNSAGSAHPQVLRFTIVRT
jgi:hypothetical protein